MANQKRFVRLNPTFGTLNASTFSTSTNSSVRACKSLGNLPRLKRNLDEKLATRSNLKLEVQRNSKFRRTRQLGETRQPTRVRTKSAISSLETTSQPDRLQCTQTASKKTSLQKAGGLMQQANVQIEKRNYCTPPPSRDGKFLEDIIYQNQNKIFESLKEIRFEDVLETSPQTPLSSERWDLFAESRLNKPRTLASSVQQAQQPLGCLFSTDSPRGKSASGRAGFRKIEIRVPCVSSYNERERDSAYLLYQHKHNHK